MQRGADAGFDSPPDCSNKTQRDSTMNIPEIITTIRSGSSNTDRHEGQRQTEEAICLLEMIQSVDGLLFSQRYKLSKILNCRCNYDDIEKAVKELKAAQAVGQWQPMKGADKESHVPVLAYDEIDGCIYRTFYSAEKGSWVIGSTGEIWNPTYFTPIPAPPEAPQQTKLES